MEATIAQKKINYTIDKLNELLDKLDDWCYDDSIPSDIRMEINGEFHTLYALVEEWTAPTYKLVVDLDERGEFGATVYSTMTELEVFCYRIGDCYPEEQGAYLINDGHMKHSMDISGLTVYLRDLGIIEYNAIVK